MSRIAKTPVFRQFATADNCWERDSLPESLADVFDHEAPLMIELGAGSCYFSTGFAKAHPDWNVVATDLKRDRLWKGNKRAIIDTLTNIAFINIDVSKLEQLVPAASVDQLWLTFPDPYPKARQTKHRMNQKSFLSTYKKLLKPDGAFHLKTDDRNFFIETIENLEKAKWQFEIVEPDLHQSTQEADVLIMTRYEQEFTAAGIPINYLKVHPR
jgi:tRNA (guanine-N7-)-methyltransferase